MPYDITEHRHRFSVWAAARAAQRGFASVEVLRDALERSGVREFLRGSEAYQTDEERFRALHEAWCRSIVRSLESSHPKATFGRAAKLIAVYLKSMVVLTRPDSVLAGIAHPPIDSILLRNIARAPEVQSPHKSAWAHLKWTQLDESSYYSLAGQLRAVIGAGEPFWKLERFWTVSEELDRSGDCPSPPVDTKPGD
jgi:hypothetical protein